ncbi:chemotaxis protein CheB [Mycobacterium parmense]|uniref:protein-glutamate methylesterase n=1 Tax=Mycobacterium parmense TaxID=185642 RepID=A0A7I7YUE7_9MYCO|nr:chemotaxis protein CheB [Mycobacterium parmense]MCV7351210.1 chemotaxis protein CheB [Mycobacterium parmense]ORW60751.1 hypothetical protein AWC20_07310 [Mycobacterium parmense]BBZ45339.1 hypothetical protein MPRM_26200 [Mycobacterium parmense]
MACDPHCPVVGLVALVASAGGLDAISSVLRDLPVDLPITVVVQQHLGRHDSALPSILRRQTARPVRWAKHGQHLAAGEVVVCPPAAYVELTPGGRCRVRAMGDFGGRRFDVLLKSIARSYGPRAAGVVLSGSGSDGAAGTAAMRRAGAVVIAESPETALYPSMPVAAARAGANRVLPCRRIAEALTDIVGGAPPTGLPPWEPADEQGEGLPRGWLDDAGSSAATRAAQARARAEELGRRRRDLSAGSRATTETLATARRRVGESRRRAQLAYQAAQEAAARWGH